MNPFIRLPQSNLESLRSGFSHGSLKYGITHAALIKNGAPPSSVDGILDYTQNHKQSPDTIIAIIDTILATRDHTKELSQALVVTGPESSHTVNLKTESRFVQLVEHAKKELMLATFALYQGDKILEPIHEAMERNPGLRVILIVNIPRKYGDITDASELVASYKQQFLSRQWIWDKKPEVYYFPDSLLMKANDRASMHAKFLVADEGRGFITSANFTNAAQKKNIEVGVELNHSLEPKALSQYFKNLIEDGVLERLV